MSGVGTGGVVGVALVVRLLAVMLLVLAGLAPWWVRGCVARDRSRALARPAPDAAPRDGRGRGGPVDGEVVLALAAAACRSGASVARVLDVVGEALGGADGAPLRSAAARLALGAEWDDAWAVRPGSGPAPGREPRRAVAGVLHEALRPTWEHGSPPAPTLRAATERLRRDRAERSATAAGRLGVRLVLPLGLCYLPAFVLVGLVPVLVSYGVGLLGSG